MKNYKAFVKREDGTMVVIESEYNTKQEFIHDLRCNGYKVNPSKVKESHIFDYIVSHTDCNPWDWSLRKIPDCAL